jgi:hypothetical protein
MVVIEILFYIGTRDLEKLGLSRIKTGGGNPSSPVTEFGVVT